MNDRTDVRHLSTAADGMVAGPLRFQSYNHQGRADDRRHGSTRPTVQEKQNHEAEPFLMKRSDSKNTETDEMFKSRRRIKYEKLKDLYQTLGGSETDLERQKSEMEIDQEQKDRDQTQKKSDSNEEAVQHIRNLDRSVKDEETANSPKEYEKDVNFKKMNPTLENDEGNDEESHREIESDELSQLEDVEEERTSRTSTRNRERDDKNKSKSKEDFELEETKNYSDFESDFESEDQDSFRTDSSISERIQTIEEEGEDEGQKKVEIKEETVSDLEKDENESERSNSSIPNSVRTHEKDPQKATETESNNPTEELKNDMKLEEYEEQEPAISISPIGKKDDHNEGLEETKADDNIENLEETKADDNIEDLEETKADDNIEDLEETKADDDIEDLEEIKADDDIEDLEETKADDNIEDLEETKADDNIEDLEDTKAVEHGRAESENIDELLNASSVGLQNENTDDIETENTDEIEPRQQNTSEIEIINAKDLKPEEQESTRAETTNVPIQSWRDMDEKNFETKWKNSDPDEYWERKAVRTSALRRSRIERNELQENRKSEERFLLNEEDSDLDELFFDPLPVSGKTTSVDRNVRNMLQAEQHFETKEQEGVNRTNNYSRIPSYGDQRSAVRIRPIYRSRQPDNSDWFTRKAENRQDDSFNVSSQVKDEIRSFESEGEPTKAIRKQELDRTNERLAKAMKNKPIENRVRQKIDDGDLQKQKKKSNDKQGTDDKKESTSDSPHKRSDEFLESWMKNIDKKLDRLSRVLPLPHSPANDAQATKPRDGRSTTLQRSRAAWASNESKAEPEELYRRNRHTLPVTDLQRRQPQPPTNRLLSRRASRQDRTISQTSTATGHFLPDISPSREPYRNPESVGQRQTMTKSRSPVKSNVNQWTLPASSRSRNVAARPGNSQPQRILVPWR